MSDASRQKYLANSKAVRLSTQVVAKLAELRIGFETPDAVLRRILKLPTKKNPGRFS